MNYNVPELEQSPATLNASPETLNVSTLTNNANTSSSDSETSIIAAPTEPALPLAALNVPTLDILELGALRAQCEYFSSRISALEDLALSNAANIARLEAELSEDSTCCTEEGCYEGCQALANCIFNSCCEVEDKKYVVRTGTGNLVSSNGVEQIQQLFVMPKKEKFFDEIKHVFEVYIGSKRLRVVAASYMTWGEVIPHVMRHISDGVQWALPKGAYVKHGAARLMPDDKVAMIVDTVVVMLSVIGGKGRKGCTCPPSRKPKKQPGIKQLVDKEINKKLGTASRRQRTAKRAVSVGRSIALHPDVQRFAVAASNVFDPRGNGAYIPNNARASQKLSGATQRTFTMAAGDKLVGLISPAAANDSASMVVWYIPAALVSNTIYLNQTGAGIASPMIFYATQCVIPYPAATSGLAARVVSFGVEFETSGAVMNQGGRLNYLIDTTCVGQPIAGAETVTLVTGIEGIITGNAAGVTKSFNQTNTHSFTVIPAAGDVTFNENNDGSLRNFGYTMITGVHEDDQQVYGYNGAGSVELNPGPGTWVSNVHTGWTSMGKAVAMWSYNAPAAQDITVKCRGHYEFAGGVAITSQTLSANHVEQSTIVHGAISEAFDTHKQNHRKSSTQHALENVMRHVEYHAKKEGPNIIAAALKQSGKGGGTSGLLGAMALAALA